MNIEGKIIEIILNTGSIHNDLYYSCKLLVYIIANMFRIYVNVMNVVYKIIESIVNTPFIHSPLLYRCKSLVYITANMFRNLCKRYEYCKRNNWKQFEHLYNSQWFHS